MKEKEPINSIAINWNRIIYLQDMGVLPIAQLPLKFEYGN